MSTNVKLSQVHRVLSLRAETHLQTWENVTRYMGTEFIHLKINYLLSIYYVPGTVLGKRHSTAEDRHGAYTHKSIQRLGAEPLTLVIKYGPVILKLECVYELPRDLAF